MTKRKHGPPVCPYCSAEAVHHETSDHIYGRNYGPVWMCAPCGAWVGCHGVSKRPLGRLANAALRKAKQQAHAAFDPLWQAKMRRQGCGKHEARSKGYAWLSQQMGLPPADTHIAMFDEAQCAQVVAICAAVRKGRST